jgi:dihydroneopterin aldolase
MALRSKWTVRVNSLRTNLRVGIYAHEWVPQPVLINLSISGLNETIPTVLSQCIDYEPICRWVTDVWPQSDHTPLLETRFNELIEYIFNSDRRIRDVCLELYKTNAFANIESVGLEREVSRRQFEEQQRSRQNHFVNTDQQAHDLTPSVLKSSKKMLTTDLKNSP